MKNDLSLTTENKIKAILVDQATKVVEESRAVSDSSLAYRTKNTSVKDYPPNNYINDTSAEENGWDAAFLATVANFYPDLPHAAEWETIARCFGYHVLTTSQDLSKCGVKGQTIGDDYRLYNHGIVSPMYANGAILFLEQAAFSYKVVGKPVPPEYYHNVASIFDRFIWPSVDTETYYWKGVPSDWAGVWNTFGVYGLSVANFAKEAGSSFELSKLDDFMSKLSIFQYEIPGNLTLADLPRVEQRSVDQDFNLNTIIAGEYYSSVALKIKSELYVSQPTSVPPTATPIPKKLGDATGDGVVDILDFARWRSEYISGSGLTSDFNNDNKIDILDFGEWRKGYLAR